MTSLLHTDKGDLITGDSNGTIYVWGRGGNFITNLIKHAHDVSGYVSKTTMLEFHSETTIYLPVSQGPVFSLLLYRTTLITGGRDSTLCSWMYNKNMDQTAKIEVFIVRKLSSTLGNIISAVVICCCSVDILSVPVSYLLM